MKLLLTRRLKRLFKRFWATLDATPPLTLVGRLSVLVIVIGSVILLDAAFWLILGPLLSLRDFNLTLWRNHELLSTIVAVALSTGLFVLPIAGIIRKQHDQAVLSFAIARRWWQLTLVPFAAALAICAFMNPVQVSNRDVSLFDILPAQIESKASCTTSAFEQSLGFDSWRNYRQSEGSFKTAVDTCEMTVKSCPEDCSFGEQPPRISGFVVVKVYGGFIWPPHLTLVIQAADAQLVANVAYDSRLNEPKAIGKDGDRGRLTFELKTTSNLPTTIQVFFNQASRQMPPLETAVAEIWYDGWRRLRR